MAKFIITGFADEIDPSLDVQMDELSKLGVRFIEMRGVDGKNVAQLTADEARDVKKRMDSRGFRVSSIGSPIGKTNITDDFTPALEQFKHVLETAQILEAPTIRLFSFFIPKGDDPAKYRDEVMRRLSVYIETAKRSGIVLCHENERDIYGDTPERCLDIMRTLGCDTFRFIFDPANFVLLEHQAVDCLRAFASLKSYVSYMHIKDGIHGQWVTPAGYGEGHLQDILQELFDDDFEGFLSLEPHLGSFKGFEKLEGNDRANSLPDGGPKQFATAHAALMHILDCIGAK